MWLVIHKKGSTSGRLSYEDAVREAFCFGWIDATANKLDHERYRLWMAPRKPRSIWSAVNKRRVEELVAEGRMREPGAAAIEAAKANGSWNALDPSDALELPDDLLDAFDRHDGSRANWDGFPPSARKQILSGSIRPSGTRPGPARGAGCEPGRSQRACQRNAPQGLRGRRAQSATGNAEATGRRASRARVA